MFLFTYLRSNRNSTVKRGQNGDRRPRPRCRLYPRCSRWMILFTVS